MSIVVNPWSKSDEWMSELARHLPGEELLLWPDVDDHEAVEMLVAWRMKRSDLASFPNLATILSMSAGTEQWQREGTPAVQIVRLVDPLMSNEMATYVLHWVVHFQRGFNARFGPEDLGRWGSEVAPGPHDYRVGILGYGTIGRRIGQAFTDLGFQVKAWSRSGTDDSSVTSYAGLENLEGFLGSCDAVVNVLPNTPATSGLLTADRWRQFKPGATFINIGRGSVVADEGELVAAVDVGQLGAVVVDVTNPEPPAPLSPLLAHPRIHVTPHIAGATQVPTAAALIAANITRIRNGEQPFPVVDTTLGY